jgi:hypothetical protein
VCCELDANHALAKAVAKRRQKAKDLSKCKAQ